MTVTGEISKAEIQKLSDSLQIGQKIKFNDHRNVINEKIEGVVVEKYEHHVLLDKGTGRTSVLWVDLIMDGYTNVSV